MAAMDVIYLTPPKPNKVIPNINLHLQFRFCHRRLRFSWRGRKAVNDDRSHSSAQLEVSRLSCFTWSVASLVLKQPPPPWRRKQQCEAAVSAGEPNDNEEENTADDDVDEALQMDGQIPETSEKFVKQVSSRAYDMRRQLKQSMDSSSYDVLEANPWRGDSKPVYVLAQGENQLWTMRTRRARSEVERELGLLFPKQGRKRTKNGTQTKKSGGDKRFHMLVEDVREGVLVFEDEEDATKYCNLLEGSHGRGCAGVAELDASSVFDLCHKMKALAVLFRRGRTHPLPDSLELDLKARKRSLEDQE